MPRIGKCLVDGFEGYEVNLIDHLEKDHADLNRTLSVDAWHDWLKRNTVVEERLLPPGVNPWIQRQYSSKIQTGIGAVEPESLQ
jgi:hypothetical protein